MQGGFIPDVVLYLSYYYTKTELPIRLAWFWISNYLSHSIGSLIGTAILQLVEQPKRPLVPRRTPLECPVRPFQRRASHLHLHLPAYACSLAR